MKSLINFVIPNNYVAVVEGSNKEYFHTLSITKPSFDNCNRNKIRLSFGRVFFLARTVEYKPQNKKGGLISFNIRSNKVGAMSTLTTLDKHRESKQTDRPRYNGVILRLDNLGVNCKYSNILNKVSYLRCLDIKGLLTNLNK